MIATKTMGANVLSQNNKSCTGGEATKKREIPAQQKQGESMRGRWRAGSGARRCSIMHGNKTEPTPIVRCA